MKRVSLCAKRNSGLSLAISMLEEYLMDQPLLFGSESEITKEEPKVSYYIKWTLAIVFLSMISLCVGSINIWPSLSSDLIKTIDGMNDKISTLTFSAGVMIMFFTLPAGIFLDKFGTGITWIIANILHIVPYYALPYVRKSTPLFIFLFIIMSFGSSSIFVTILQTVLARSPPTVKGLCTSIVSGSVTMAFGLWLQMFLVGGKVFNCTGDCIVEKLKFICIANPSIVCVASPIAYYLFNQFKPKQSNTDGNSLIGSTAHKLTYKDIFKNPKLYFLIALILVCVFDGLCVISGGDIIWNKYGNGYPGAAQKYGIVFSAVNFVCTILLSILVDTIVSKSDKPRRRWFSLFWIIFAIIPLLVGLVFKYTNIEIVFVICISMMGIPFGFGLAQIPALVSEIFGNNNYGLAFGIVQIGSVASSISAMPLIQIMNNQAIISMFFVLAVLHVAESVGWYYLNIRNDTRVDYHPI